MRIPAAYMVSTDKHQAKELTVCTSSWLRPSCRSRASRRRSSSCTRPFQRAPSTPDRKFPASHGSARVAKALTTDRPLISVSSPRFAQVTDRVVALCMVAAALLMALCASGWLGPQATLWLLALTGFAVGIGGPSRDLMIKKGTPKEATGRVYGLVYSGLDVGFALSPLVFGLFMDQGWYTATLLGAALVLFISAGVALGVGQRSAPH